MLKKRIIPVLLLRGGRLVKTICFDSFREVGDPIRSAAVYNAQSADELIFLNINRDEATADSLVGLIEKVSEVCFMPLIVGGGIRSFSDASLLIRNGADKVVLNSIAYRTPEVIERIADAFGSQAVVVGIDVRWDMDACRYVLYSHGGSRIEPFGLDAHIRKCVRLGAGEIFVQSIDREGTMTGFDTELIIRVMAATDVPVIACGGAGNYDHLRVAFAETKVNALACGSLFNFTDSSPIRAKAFLANEGFPFKVV